MPSLYVFAALVLLGAGAMGSATGGRVARRDKRHDRKLVDDTANITVQCAESHGGTCCDVSALQRGSCARRAAPVCTGTRRSTDAIMFLGQKQHATYDASHDALGFLRRAVASLVTHVATLKAHDILLWHEGGPRGFTEEDLSSLGIGAASGFNGRLCMLDCCSGWGAPPALSEIPYYLHGVSPPKHWAPGYMYMIRFYAITMWKVLHRLGYKCVPM
jgi:hypothetical protein